MQADNQDLSQWLFPVTASDFDARVAKASVPVLVDFWAPWCGPCQQIAPVLDALVQRYQGRLHVAKVNVDEEQTLAAGFGVRSIPMLVLFHGGKVAETIVGLRSETELTELVDQFVTKAPNQARRAVQDAIMAGDHTAAIALLEAALKIEPDHPGMLADIARSELALGNATNARAALERLPQEARESEDIVRLAGRIGFAERAGDLPDIETLRQQLAAQPEDLQAHYQLAVREAVDGKLAKAMQLLMHVLRVDKGYAEGLAKQTLLQVFEVAGSGDSDVQRTRRELATLLN